MACNVCTSDKKPSYPDMEILNLDSNYTKVVPGHTYKITFKIHSTAWIPGYIQVMINAQDIDSGACLYNVNSQDIGYDETVSHSFEGIMPSRELRIRLSVWDKGLIYDDCEDTKDITLQVGTTDEKPKTSESTNVLVYAAAGVGILVLYTVLTRNTDSVVRAKHAAKAEYGKAKSAYKKLRS